MKLFCLFLICFILIVPSISITEEGKESVAAPFSPGEVSEHYAQTKSTSVETAIGPSNIEIRGLSGKEPLEAQGPKKATFSEEPLKIVKIISPHPDGEGLRSGDLVRVSVEIYPKNEMNISIREFIDKDIPVFLSSVHGYILSDLDKISYYKLDLLNDIECNKLNTCLDNDYIKFQCNGNNCKICKKQLYDINNYNKKPYLDDGLPLFDLGTIKNGNLTDYSCLLNFIKNNIIAINDTELNHSKIFCSADGNISIKFYENELLTINKSKSYLDNGWVVLSYKNNDSTGMIVHHMKLLDVKQVFDPGNSIAIDNIYLPGGSIFVFWYYILPKSPGTYSTETITSIADPKLIISSPLDLQIVEDQPQFKVYRKLDQSRIFLQDCLEIEFDVEYLGGGSPATIKNVPVRYDISPEDFHYVPNLNLSFNGTFYKNKSISMTKKIRFHKEGMLSPPGIWINDRHFNFDGSVEVDIPLIRYLNLISIISTIFLFFIGIIIKDLLLHDEKEREAWIERIISKSMILERKMVEGDNTGVAGKTQTIKFKDNISKKVVFIVFILAFVLILLILMKIFWLLGYV
jgi:hypothetical protein